MLCKSELCKRVKEENIADMIFPRIIWCYCFLIFQVMCRDPPIVKIKDQGMVSGMFLTMHRTQRILAYMGIPFAMPPLDSLRFAVPVINMLPASIHKRHCVVTLTFNCSNFLYIKFFV